MRKNTKTMGIGKKLEILQSLRGLYDGLALPPPSTGLSRLRFSRIPSHCPLESPPPLVDIELHYK